MESTGSLLAGILVTCELNAQRLASALAPLLVLNLGIASCFSCTVGDVLN